jgi:hypothetical protein
MRDWSVSERLRWRHGLRSLDVAEFVPDKVLAARWDDLDLDDAEALRDGLLAAERHLQKVMDGT